MPRFDKLLNPAFCANNVNSPCPNNTSKANKACSRCLLVVYCSEECQNEHWPTHEKDCKNIFTQESWKPHWHTADRVPTFRKESDPYEPNTNKGKISWWGSMPAVDLLKLDANEGQDAPPKLSILFAASHDIRNMVETIARLPDMYSGQCEMVMNGIHPEIFTQNIILVLVAFHFPPEEAAPIMIHLWYSALIPSSVLAALRAKILPLIHEVCVPADYEPYVPVYEMVCKKNKASLCIELPREEWHRLRKYLEVPPRLSATTAAENRHEVTLALSRKDEIHRFLYTQPRYWRVSSVKFRADGILLPFGCSREEFDTPNPTLFHDSHAWPMPDTADPRTSWSLLEICNGSYTANYSARNDLYGLIFIHLRETLLRFCRQIAKRDISIRLISIDLQKLPIYFDQQDECVIFDRIETYATAESEILRIENVLSLFGHLLKPKILNPKAMLLVLLVRDIEAMWTGESIDTELTRVAKYIPQAKSTSRNDADYLKSLLASTFFRDVTKLFDLYKKAAKFDALARYGLKIREKSTVVPHWPMRPGKHPAQQVFEILLASGATGLERYIEWERE